MELLQSKIIEIKNNFDIQFGDYTVYCHINKVNNKKYIGITKQNVKDRWKNGKGYHHCPRFYSAIEFYGWENFEHIILFENILDKNAFDIERFLIKELDLQNLENGYNIANGGQENPMLNNHHTNETKQKISEHNKEYYATHEHPWQGKNHTEESKEKMMMSNNDRQEVLCVETGIIYPSIREAAKQMNLKSKNSIIIALNDKTKTARKYHWQRV